MYLSSPHTLPSDEWTYEESLANWKDDYGDLWQTVVIPAYEKFEAERQASGSSRPSLLPRVTAGEYVSAVDKRCNQESSNEVGG